jgi:hypothetical protein
MKWTLPKQVLAVLTGSALLAAYPLAVYTSREIIAAVAAGALLSTLNIMLGYAAIEYTSGKSMTTFTNTVIGGMGIRLALLLGAMAFLILVLDFHTTALAASLFLYYAVYLVLEILYIQHRIQSAPSHDASARS